MRNIIAKLRTDDSGMTTAEYAVGTCAAAGLGGVLIKLLSSDEVRGLLANVIQMAFSFLLG
jgi:Flp pilus assembly pilin Flp